MNTKTKLYILVFLLIKIISSVTVKADTEMPAFSLKYMNSEYKSPVLLGRKKFFDTQREIQKDVLYFNTLNNCFKFNSESIYKQEILDLKTEIEKLKQQ